FAHHFEHALAHFVEPSWNECSGGGLVSAAAKLLSQLVAVDLATAAEAELESTGCLLDEDYCEQCSLDAQGEIDHVLRVAGTRTEPAKILLECIRVGQAAIEFERDARQNLAPQPHSAQRILLIKLLVNFRWLRAGIDQPGRDG